MLLNLLRRFKHSTLRKWRGVLIQVGEQHVFNKTNGRVAKGIFADSQLVDGQIFGAKTAKTLGTYELELHSYLEEVMERKPQLVCNIGAAEGYYAIGLACKKYIQKVIVYEALESGRKLIQKNAEANGVEDKIEIHGICSSDTLLTTLQENKIDLFILDIEGAELDILTKDNISLLSNSELLIESHDFCRPNCLETLISRLCHTHHLLEIKSRVRQASDFTIDSWLPDKLKIDLMDEMRPGEMTWLACTPKIINENLSKINGAIRGTVQK